MTTSTQVSELKINKLTKAQYQGIEEPSDTELYFVTDEDTTLPSQTGNAGKFLTTNGSAASWAEVGSTLPSQTGNAGKFLTTDGTDASWAEVQSGNGFNLFDIVMKDHILDFEESEGFGSLGTYVYKDAVAGSRYGYPDFYAKCLEEYQDVNNTTETISDITITINANGHKFYDIADKAAIDTIYNSTGEAWFYGIDTTNERIFLPRDNEVMHGKLVESSIEDTNWYRIYSDGWCEQGGKVDLTGTGTKTVNLLKPYKDLNYSVLQSFGTTQSSDFSSNTSLHPVTVSTIGGYFASSVANNHFWRTSGYIDSSYESYKKPYIVVGNTAQTKAITDVTDITTSENDTLPLFTGMYFDYNPNNVGWLLGGEQANSGSIYTTAYNELVNELTLPKYNLKVIEEEDMVSGTDYSEYWIINQTQQYFICPTKLSYDVLSGSEIPVYGNGMTLGLTDGTTNYGIADSQSGIVDWSNNYGTSVGTTGGQGTYASGKTLGITLDPTKSGIATDLNSAKSSTAKLYFKVANAVENLELLDAGEVMEALSGKVSTSDLSEIYPVVETYSNGTSWYRLYSDGWCEQGGYSTTNGTYAISLLKSMANTDYSVSLIESSNGTNNPAGSQNSIPIKGSCTTNSIYVYVNTSSGLGAYWEVKGYVEV